MEFKDPKDAFDTAIKDGRLSADPEADTYAGRFMNMGTIDGKDLFKNIMTRQYID